MDKASSNSGVTGRRTKGSGVSSIKVHHPPAITKKAPVPHPPTSSSVTKDNPLPVTSYKTTQLRRDRFKKPVPSCRSAPLLFHSDTVTHKETAKTYHDDREVESGTGSCSAVDLLGSDSQRYAQQSPTSVSRDPILAYISTARSKLGLYTRSERHSEDVGTARENLLADAGPITGVKDLKLLSRRLSSLSDIMSTRGDNKPGGTTVEFVYALRCDTPVKFNPYDLCIVSPEKARTHQSYYTISAYSVTKVERHKGMDTVHVQRWLWERDMFYRLLSIPFVAKFKLSKTFLAWRKMVCQQKHSSHRSSLHLALFSADVLLQSAILQIQHLCESASTSALPYPAAKNEIALVDMSRSVIYSLEDFMELQEKMLARAKNQLANLRESIVAVTLSACKIVVENKGILGLTEDVPKENEPSHIQVLEWRKDLERLERFVSLCNNLVLQLLQRLVLKAITALEHRVKQSTKMAVSKTEEQNKLFQEMRDKVLSQPHMAGVVNRFDYDEEEADTLQLAVATPSLPSDTVSYDDVSVPFSVESVGEEEEEKDEQGDSVLNLLFKKKPEPVLPLWEVQLEVLLSDHDTLENGTPPSVHPGVILQPSKESFLSAFNRLLKQYETAIASFESLLKDTRLRPYISRSKYDFLMMLEEGRSKERAKVWPDTTTLLYSYSPYCLAVEYLRKTLQQTMNVIERQSMNYQCFVEMVQICNGMNVRTSMKEKEWNAPMFQKTFALLHDQVFGMDSMVLSFQTGMVMVNVSRLKQTCLAHPRNILKELEYLLPKLAADKSDVFVRKIKVTTDKLLNTPTDVYSFIQYLDDVDEAIDLLPEMETELHTITSLYSVAQQFDVEISEEETALYKALFPQFRHLKNVLMQAQATKSETVHQFGDDLKSQVVALLREAMELKNDIESGGLLEKSPQEALQQLKVCETQLNRMISQAKNYVNYHHRFGKVPTSRRRYHSTVSSSQSWTPEEVYDEVTAVQQALEVRQTLFSTTESWTSKFTEWTTQPLNSLNVSKIRNETNSFLTTVDYLEKGLVHSNKLVRSLQEQVVLFRSWLPTISCLLNPSLKIRHWESIQQATSGTVSKGSDITIAALKEMKVFDHHSVITGISNQANQEATLENLLKTVSNEWLTWEFTLVAYKGLSERQTHILGGIDDLLSSLEDSLTTLSTIKSSRYVEPIKHAVSDWERRLLLMLEVTEYWALCQKNWLYLESIFSAIDIQRQLTSEAKLFLQADKSWRETIRIITDKPTALKATNTPGVLEAFQACNVLLEQVFKSLEDYLESKRCVFPRFYFISNNELLDILAHTKQPATVQPYLSKIFGNIRRLEMSSETQVAPPIHALVSAEEERIELTKKLPARGSPEMWLDALEKAMMATVKRLLKTGVTTIGTSERKDWVVEHPGQVVLTVAQIDWTRKVESSFQTENGMKDLHKTWLGYLDSLAKLVTEGEASVAQNNVIASLLTLDIHNRDVIQTLVGNRTTNQADFEWSRHLRYYWNESDSGCDLRQFCAAFTYGNEYLGCLPRLVITPLTERCYFTLTTAMHLNLGGSPIGPAGTGKSETVKDLAKAMGKLCLVFNCSEGLNYKLMGQFFSGICQSGIWCCFDEFNRIDVEVLSVVAQHLQCIKTAKDSCVNRFCFEGKEVKLVSSCAAFITMNPGYAGRVELPDNLKSLFRPVAMMVPDVQMIVEVLLFRCGFTTAPSLATKVTKVYEYAKAQLSYQKHYDFGLRAAIAVVALAGKYLQQKKRCNTSCHSTDEMRVILEAFRDSNHPKLLAEDVNIMNMILCDIFQLNEGGEPSTEISILKSYIENAAKDHLLQHRPEQVEKCCQLYTTLLVRHGVVLLGPTGGGKSSVVTLLTSALNGAHRDYYGDTATTKRLSLNASLTLAGSLTEAVQMKHSHCQLKVVYPKSISLGELYGYCDSATFEWKNGVFSKTVHMFSHQMELYLKLAREREIKDLKKNSSSETSVDSDRDDNKQLSGTEDVSEAEGNNNVSEGLTATGLCYPSCAPVGWKWIMLDGPVDPGWIENLNSTLDDAKVFCLANGERIQFLPGMRLLFETDNLDNASPATISRCGMVYMDPHDLGWRPYVLSWMKTLPETKCFTEEKREYLLKLFDLSIEEGIKFLEEHKIELTCPVPAISAVKTLCLILYGVISYIAKDSEMMQSVANGKMVTDAEQSVSNLHRKSVAGIFIPSKKLLRSSTHLRLQHSHSPGHRQGFCIPNFDTVCEILGKLYVFAFTWSFGGCFETSESEEENPDQTSGIFRGGSTARQKFDALVHRVFSGNRDSDIHVDLPATSDLIYSYYFDINSHSFKQWKTLVPSSKQILTQLSLKQKGFENVYQPSSPYLLNSDTVIGRLYRASTMSMVPTVDTVRLCFLAVLLLRQTSSYSNVFVAGKTGVGKTQLLSYLSNALKQPKQCADILSSVFDTKTNLSSSSRTSTPLHVGFNTHQVEEKKEDVESDLSLLYHVTPETVASRLQSVIENQLVRKGGNALSPSSGRKLFMCLDDLNVTTPDQYGTQQSTELLRQMVDGEGLYDQKNYTWKKINDVRFLATIRRRGWEATPMSNRCLSKFSVLCLPEPSSSTLHAIYSTHVTKSFTMNKFSDEVLSSIPNAIACSIHVYHESKNQLLPTPATPQYVFCTKDLSKVFTGLLRVNHRSLQSQSDVINLLSHELLRVFHDRCLPQDREHLLEILSEGLRIHFKVVQSPSQIKEQLLLYEGFTDSLRGYSAVKNTKKLVKHLERLQNQYNLAQDKNLQLVFFPLACEHLTRMTRVLKQPGGHLTLIGMGGVGKRSCLQLAAHIVDCQYHYLALDYNHNTSDCEEEFKNVLVQCGVEEKPTVLVVSENCANQEFVFRAFHELIVSSEVRDLFSKDEMEVITNQIAEKEALEEGEIVHSTSLSSQILHRMFVERVRRNLHLVMCFTPSSHRLVEMCRKYPSFVTHATVDVYDEWPSKALYGVALKEINTNEISRNELRGLLKEMLNQIVATCIKVHSIIVPAIHKAQYNSELALSVTSSTFIYFIQMFCKTLLQQQHKINTQKVYLEAGLDHLHSADEKVLQMKAELEQLQPEINTKAQEAEALLKQLSVEQHQLDELRAVVAKERADIARESDYVTKLAKESEEDLNSVLPVLKSAEKGLNALKKTDLLEIRSYGTPPSMVVHVMSAVCVLLQQPTDWNTVKHLMADPVAFLKSLTGFNKDAVPDKVFSKLKRYINDPNFQPDKVAHYSVACQSFCQWVLAIEHYGRVYRVVEPKRQLHLETSAKLQTVKDKLRKKEAQLDELECELAELNEKYLSKVNERDILEGNKEQISIELRRAETLTQSLCDEQARWQELLTALHSQTSTLTGDSILSAACLVYLGPFPLPLRQSLMTKWKQLCEESKILHNSSYNMVVLAESEQVLDWYVNHLPKDSCSVQNAILIENSEKWPFIIDPQLQATKWLKAMYASHGLMIVSYNSRELAKLLEQAVSTGLPVMIEDVPEQLGTALDPFLLRKIVTTNGQQFLRAGKVEIPYNPSFRLFLVSHRADLKLTSELCLKTTVVNFAATFEGLQDQLLSTIIMLEEPELEAQYTTLLRDISSDKRQLREMEQKLLDILKSSTGNLLKDDELVETLQGAKQVASEVEKRLEKAQLTKDELQSTRHKYQPLATRGSILYFSTTELRHLSVMYQFSIERFYQLFVKSICSIQSPKLGGEASVKYGVYFQEYLAKLIKNFTKILHEEISIALSSEHYLPFVFKLCCSVLQRGDSVMNIEPSIKNNEWSMMVERNQTIPSTTDNKRIGGDTSKLPGNPHKLSSSHHQRKMHSKFEKPDFLSDAAWETMARMEKTMSCFRGLQKHVLGNTELWTLFVNSNDPWMFDFADTTLAAPSSTAPNSRSKRTSQPFIPSLLSPFQKLLLIKACSPKNLSSAVRKFISMEMGPSYIVKPLYNLRNVLERTAPTFSPTTPVLFILSPDTDPKAQLSQLATKVLPSRSYLESVSLGQGQGKRALELIHSAIHKGKWVFLQNCHLAPSWMPELESLLKRLQSAAEPHGNFRLWLSSKETCVIPSAVLQSSIKVSLEPPQGIRSSMQQLFSSQDSSPAVIQQVFEEEECSVQWKHLVYSLCLFHAVANGRKVYGTAGWRIPYGFGSGDLQVTIQLLRTGMMGTPLPSILWSTVHYLAGEICYGGKVTDPQDFLCLKALLHKFCGDHALQNGGNPKEVFSLKTSYAECCAAIDDWPAEDTPDLLGLPSALKSVTCATESQKFHSFLHMMESGKEAKILLKGQHNELLLERASQLLERLPLPIDLSLFKTSEKKSIQLSPYWVLFINEVSLWNQRLKVVSTTLQNVVVSVKGESVVDEETEAMYQALACGEVPRIWQFFADNDLTLSKWTEKFVDCFRHVTRWTSLNQSLTPLTDSVPHLPEKIWYPSIASPQRLFAAIMQTYARSNGVSPEDVFLVLEDAARSNTEGPYAVVISGLCLEAAGWSSEHGLVDSLDTKHLCSLPDMICSPLKVLQRDELSGAQDTWYSCPLYTSKMKHEMVTKIPLRASMESGHWCLCGTALFPVPVILT